jgi:hypothetical protein
MEDYLFKSVVKQSALGGLAGAGLIGLAPYPMQGAQLFVPSLFEQKAIQHNMFSVFITDDGTSKMQIGGYDLEKYAQSPLKWYKISNPHFWQVPFHHVQIGDMTFQPSVSSIMADTGTSLNMIPESDYKKIFKSQFSRMQCHKLPNTLDSCACSEAEYAKIPDISFKV